MPQFKTQKARLLAVIDEYNRHYPGPCTMEAVAFWALANGLYPVPKRGCTDAEAAEWESRLGHSAKLPEVANA